MRALLIEDDNITLHSVEMMLTREGFNVHTTDSGEEGIDLGKHYDYDAIVLDLDLPDLNGMRVLQSLRTAEVHTPVLILSGDGTVDVRVKALSTGADDFITKPFHKDELVARIRAVIRRSCSHAQSIITVGKLSVDLNEKLVRVEGAKINLTIKEYQMLEALVVRRGSTLSKDALLNQLYNGMDEPEQKIIDVFVCKLRKKLVAATNGDQYITTVWGRGYQLEAPSVSLQRSDTWPNIDAWK